MMSWITVALLPAERQLRQPTFIDEQLPAVCRSPLLTFGYTGPRLSRFTFSSTCQAISLIMPTLIIRHSFSPGSKPTLSTNPSNLRLLLPTGLPSSVYFWLSHFNFLFIPCGCPAGYPSAFYCTLNTHYRIVSYST